ncbi:MAG TPA: hypothetical protein VMT99_03900 [Candidatus Paceibacterota bacterium]|nr:hypothetical protein [Candidatus Paceibacterota bacterium]
MKKATSALAVITLAAIAGGAALTANAQLFTYSGTTTTPSSSVVSTTASSSPAETSTSSGSVLGAATSTTTSSTVPTVSPAVVSVTPQWIQVNGLTVTGMSSTLKPATLAASTPSPSCETFADQSSAFGTAVTCPAVSSYEIAVDQATVVRLRDRSVGVLANVTTGDVVNVFGSLTADGTLQATILRDLSKPQVGLVPSTGFPSGGGTTIAGTGTSNDAILSLAAALLTLFPNLAATMTSSGTLPADLRSFGATITQVNADGSFVVRLTDGRTFTVPNVIRVGTTVTLGQVVDWINAHWNSITGTASGTMPASGLMIPYNGSTSVATPSGTPNIY